MRRLMKRLLTWLHPCTPELQQLTVQRKELVSEARLRSALVTLHARELIQETTAERERTEAKIGPIDDLLKQMDKRRHD